MFSNSTQLKYWTFSGTTELNKLHAETNRKYVTTHALKDGKQEEDFLTSAEEKMICRHYEYVLKLFCGRFEPPMPRSVVGIAMVYFKRFYLHISIMDYNPKHILYTCVYLACKVDEFNVSIMQFVGNLPADVDREKATDIILAHELLLMQKLNYNLTIHTPYRPMEGLLIDIKTRCSSVVDADSLRAGADDFIDQCLNTDVSLIFAPSQIALSAILSAASKLGINLDSYVANTLLNCGKKENLLKSVECLKRIRFLVKQSDALNRDDVRAAESKLLKCRNEANDPETIAYQQKMEELFDEEDERKETKRYKRSEESKRDNLTLLGL